MNLFRNYRRTLAILLTIALGTGVLFAFQGFINGVLIQYRESTIHAHSGHGQINTKGYRDAYYAEPWNHWITNSYEVQNFLKTVPNVQHVFPRVSFPALLKKGTTSVSGSGQGVEAENEASFFNALNIEKGVTLKDQQKGILLGHGLAKSLDVQPGDIITVMVNSIFDTITQDNFTVVGIFQTGSQDFDSRIFRIQLNQALNLLQTRNIESISLGIRDYTDWDGVAAAVQKKFPKLEAASFAELDKIYYQHSVDWLNAQFLVIQVIILSIVLLGIFNTVSAAILERKQEIGNFRANGESVWDVMKLIIMEGAFLGILGSLIGIALTYVVLNHLLNNRIQMPPGPGLTLSFYVSFAFTWKMVWTTIVLTTLAAIIASILAGIKVARMPIANALREH